MTPMMRNRVAIVVCVAVPLAAIDLVVKSTRATAPLFSHHRSGAWMVLSAVVLVFALLLTRFPSRLLASGAGLFAAGALGNLVSTLLHHGRVPNPFVIAGGDQEIAFNLADLFALGGIALLIFAAARLSVRYRHRLPRSTFTVRLARRVLSLLAPD